MKKPIENLHTSKITGGRRHVLRSRRKYEIDRFPNEALIGCLLYTSPSPRDVEESRMPSSA